MCCVGVRDRLLGVGHRGNAVPRGEGHGVVGVEREDAIGVPEGVVCVLRVRCRRLDCVSCVCRRACVRSCSCSGWWVGCVVAVCGVFVKQAKGRSVATPT